MYPAVPSCTQLYPAVPSCTHTLVICAAYARHIPGTRRVLGGYYPGTTRVLPGVLLAPTPQQFPSLKSFTQWTGGASGRWYSRAALRRLATSVPRVRRGRNLLMIDSMRWYSAKL